MYLEGCTKDQLKNIYNEFNATPESVQNDVEYLMEWMEKQPHLPNIKDKEFLASFLLRCKNSLERTKRRLDLYYGSRAVMPDIFCNRDPYSPEFLESSKVVMFTPLPKLTPEGRRILFIHMYNNTCGNKTSAEIILKGLQMFIDVMLKSDPSVEQIGVFDFENMTVPLVAIGFTILKTFLLLCTRSSPFRFHKVYYVNLMPAIEPLISLSKTLIPKKMSDRFVVWKKKPTDLVEIFPKKILPSNYGGDDIPLKKMADQWIEYVQDHAKWLQSEAQVTADLSKRPGGNKIYNDLGFYGVEGSFRKICLD